MARRTRALISFAGKPKQTHQFGSRHKSAGACLALLLIVALAQTSAQDLLRNKPLRPGRSSQQQQNAAQTSNPLANIQLPPQLASLTPQQLHQLAQLRELQLQQEAAQRQQEQQQPVAPAPIGLEAAAAGQQQQPQPTAQPAASQQTGQIPQPSLAASSAAGDSNERHDDGAYNESGSELEGVAAPSERAEPSGATSAAPAQQAAPTFEVNWNKCPQLEPNESEKNKKTQVITKCLQAAPIPTNLTRENVEAHREQIATCALKVEGWFDETGSYKYDKAEGEIRAKKLDAPIELQVLKFHVACKEEASKKFPRAENKLIDQVQFYQACMDYYISIVCEIEVSVDQ